MRCTELESGGDLSGGSVAESQLMCPVAGRSTATTWEMKATHTLPLRCLPARVLTCNPCH